MIRHPSALFPGKFFRAILPFAAVGALVAGCGETDGSEEAANGEPDTALDNGAEEEASSQAEEPLVAIPAGTRLVFEVGEDVSTDSHDRGESFTLRLAEPVQGTSGLSVEAGNPARGTVTVSTPSSDSEEEAVLAVQVESLRIDGRERALNGVVEEADTDAAAGDSGARSAAKVATGAAAGAIIGQVLGRDTRSTVQGAAAGAVAGLGVALTTRDGHAVLPEGSLVTVRLEDALVVN